MPPDRKDLLEDIIAAVHIRSVTSGMDLEEFFQDYKATAAVETVKELNNRLLELFFMITEYRSM